MEITAEAHVMDTALIPFVDWVRLCGKLPSRFVVDKLIELLQFRALITFDWDSPKGSSDFSGSWKHYTGTSGVSISIYEAAGVDEVGVRLNFPGEYIAGEQPWYFHGTLVLLHERFALHCTRFDIAVDDRLKEIKHRQLFESARDEGTGVGFREVRYIESVNSAKNGITVYCGERRSAKFARFYQRGDVDRFEVEFKLDLANSIFVDYVCSGRNDICRVLSGALKGAIDFVDRKDKNLSRATQCIWWTNFIGRITGDAFTYPREKKKTSIERSMAWIERSVSKTLLKVAASLGLEGFDKFILCAMESARERITAYDNFQVSEYIQQNPIHI
jgi:hypothetical protein